MESWFVDSTDRQFDRRNGRLVPSVLGLVGYRVGKESKALNYAKLSTLPLRLHDNYSRPLQKPLPKRVRDWQKHGDFLLQRINLRPTLNPIGRFWRRVPLYFQGRRLRPRAQGWDSANPKSQKPKTRTCNSGTRIRT